jgi:hypothetical protein
MLQVEVEREGVRLADEFRDDWFHRRKSEQLVIW